MVLIGGYQESSRIAARISASASSAEPWLKYLRLACPESRRSCRMDDERIVEPTISILMYSLSASAGS
jgi:hypothetical protein